MQSPAICLITAAFRSFAPKRYSTIVCRGKASKGWFGSKKGVDGASSGSGSPTTGDPKTTNPATGASVKA